MLAPNGDRINLPRSVGAAASDYKPVQSGGHTIKPATARTLDDYFGKNYGTHGWKQPLESLKKDLGLPNGYHGTIMSNGDYVSMDKKTVLGNLGEYLK